MVPAPDFNPTQWTYWAAWIGLGVFVLWIAIAVCYFLDRKRRVKGEVTAPGNCPSSEQPKGNPFARLTRQEKRQACRRKGCDVAVLVSNEDAQMSPYEGMVTDRSLGGLRLAVSNPIPVGTVLTVRPVRVTALIPWVALEVKSCKQSQTGWDLGCQFVKIPPSGILWLFG